MHGDADGLGCRQNQVRSFTNTATHVHEYGVDILSSFFGTFFLEENEVKLLLKALYLIVCVSVANLRIETESGECMLRRTGEKTILKSMSK